MLMHFLTFVAMGAAPCTPLDAAKFDRMVATVRQSGRLTETSNRIVDLNIYWESICPVARREITEDQVRRLAELLTMPAARLTALKILDDVGPSVAVACPGVQLVLERERARLEDQLRYNEVVVGRARPVLEALKHFEKKNCLS